MDISRFLLRSVEKYIKWFRYLIIVWPDNINLSPSINRTSPIIKIVPYSHFIPDLYLPTYNPEVVKYYLPQILGITDQFVILNENTFLVDQLELSYFRDPTDGFLILRTIPANRPSHGFILDNVISNTRKFFHDGSDPKLDSFGPQLIDTSIAKQIQTEYKYALMNTTTHRFLFPEDFSYNYFYLLYIKDRFPNTLHLKETVVEFIYARITDDDLYNYLISIYTKSKILFLSDEILKIRLRVGLDTLFYRIYPEKSLLEMNMEDYESLGLIIGIGFLLGFIGCCYGITRSMGGHIKQKDIIEDRQR